MSKEHLMTINRFGNNTRGKQNVEDSNILAYPRRGQKSRSELSLTMKSLQCLSLE